MQRQDVAVDLGSRADWDWQLTGTGTGTGQVRGAAALRLQLTLEHPTTARAAQLGRCKLHTYSCITSVDVTAYAYCFLVWSLYCSTRSVTVGLLRARPWHSLSQSRLPRASLEVEASRERAC